MPDCDDTNPHVYPGAEETCNHTDDDCDESIDEGFDLPAHGLVKGDSPIPQTRFPLIDGPSGP